MIACRHRIPNKWYHFSQFPGTTDHQCPLKAKRDGYCDRHHPEKLLVTLLAKQKDLSGRLSLVRAQVAELKERLIQETPNPT